MDSNTLRQTIETFTLPDSRLTIAAANALQQCEIRDNTLYIRLLFDLPVAHLDNPLKTGITSALSAIGWTGAVDITLDSRIRTHSVQAGIKTILGVKNIIAVASGKGGVGKSTTAANLAVAMQRLGARTGILDADLYGPSQPAMFGLTGQTPQQQDGRFIPVSTPEGIQIMSIGFLVDTDQAVVWRGPMVSQALQQLLFQTSWNDVDYLFIDLPPGTGDIQLTLSQKIPVTGALVVTTPQDIALLDARKAVDMFNKVNIPIFGVLENMSVHICSNCGHREDLFGSGGGAQLAEKLAVPLLGRLPLSLPLREAMDAGSADTLYQLDPAAGELYHAAAWQLALAVAAKTRDFSKRFPKIVVE